MADTRHHVVVLGGGFGGLAAAQALARRPVRVTLVDRRNHHVFQPLLYQVATAGLSAPDIAAPIRRIVQRHRNVDVLLAEARGIDLARRAVLLDEGELAYDSLIVATGATHSYFGHDEWAEHAPGLKTLEDALLIRRRVLLAFERADRETDEALRRRWLTFVVIGAGPTGVEMAGTMAEIARHTLRADFRHIDPGTARVVLVEAIDRVLPPYPPDLSARARTQLERLGVEVRTNTRVTGVDAGGVWLGEERLDARTVVWAAGVAASPLGRALSASVDRAGRVPVEPDLTLPGHSEVYVIGDLAAMKQDGEPVPGVAPAAMQMGRHAARNVLRTMAGRERAPFRYVDKGSLATIGRKSGVALFGRFRMWGFPAWAAWLAVHIFFLIGFRNRLVVMTDWAWSYFTHQRFARLILEVERPPDARTTGPARST
jgi:NADH:quinone reductase (non-electrogenic)